MARILSLVVLLFFRPEPALAAESLPPALNEIGVYSTMGAQVPLEEEFMDEEGKTVRLSSFFGAREPVVLILNYYSCPMLCGRLLNAARDGLQQMNWTPKDHYKIVTISIDPKEDSDLAMSKKISILGSLKDKSFREEAEKNWHFLVGKKGSEARVAGAVGFRYKWIPEEKQYAHGAAIFFLTPTGKLARVLEGLIYPARDLKLAILEASDGKIGSFAEKLMLFCYHWDPKEKKSVLLASRLVTMGGAVTVAGFLLFYALCFFRNRRKGTTCSLSP